MSGPVIVAPFRVGMSAAIKPWALDPSATPPVALVDLATRAVAAIDPDVPVGKLLPRTIDVLFGHVENIPGTNSPAAGYTDRGPLVRVRYDIQGAANLRPATVEYTILHEGLGHSRLALVPMAPTNMTKCLGLLVGPAIPAFTDPHEVWRQAPGDGEIAKKLGISAYWLRPYEAIIDAMVEAISGVDSPFRAQYARHIRRSDYGQLKAIWLDGLTAAPAPQPDPTPDPPLPLPPDPAALQAQINVLTAQLDQVDAERLSAQMDLLDRQSRLDAAKQKGAEIAAL